MSDYPYIRAYGAINGSDASYIDEQVAKARRLKAASDTFAFVADAAGGLDYPLTLAMLEASPYGQTVSGVTAYRLRKAVEQTEIEQ